MEKEIIDFLSKDKINLSKFSVNYEIIRLGDKEIYKADAELHSKDDLSIYATETIDWMSDILHQPLGYPFWFMAAYPDTVKYFSDLNQESLTKILGNLTEEDFDNNKHFNLSTLRKLVDAYKLNNILETI